jgi:hypothetical protein
LRSEEGGVAERALKVGEILARLGGIARANAGFVLSCIAGLTAISVLADQVSTGLIAILPGMIGGVVAHYYLAVRALERLGLRKGRAPNRFWDFWGLLILSGIGAFFGFVLLIVPGFYISARWAAAGAVLVSGDGQVGDALDRSWAMSGPSAWSIVATWLAMSLPGALTGFGLIIAFEIWLPFLARPMLHVVVFGASVASWLIGIAVYSLLRPPTDHLAEVLA